MHIHNNNLLEHINHLGYAPLACLGSRHWTLLTTIVSVRHILQTTWEVTRRSYIWEHTPFMQKNFLKNENKETHECMSWGPWINHVAHTTFFIEPTALQWVVISVYRVRGLTYTSKLLLCSITYVYFMYPCFNSFQELLNLLRDSLNGFFSLSLKKYK